MIIQSKQINLSSSQSKIKSSKHSNLYFELSGLVSYEQNVLYNAVSVTHAEIPVSYYIINESNNTLYLSTGIYTLNKGNYTANDFIAMIKSILPSGFNISLNKFDGKFTLSYTEMFQILNYSTCYTLMGFEKNQIYISDANNKILMPYPCNFLGINRILIRSNIFSTQNYDSNGRSTILCSIPVNEPPYSLIVYNNFSNFKSFIHNTDINYIDLQITDDSSNLLDFNNIEINLTLQIDTYYKEIPKNTYLSQLYDTKKQNNIDNKSETK